MSRTMSGTWAIGSIDLGTTLVSGRRRVPTPPTSTTARISRWWSSGPAPVVAVGAVVAVPAVVAVVSPGTVEPTEVSAGTEPPGATVLGDSVAPESTAPSSSSCAADWGIGMSTSRGWKAMVNTRPSLSTRMSSKSET